MGQYLPLLVTGEAVQEEAKARPIVWSPSVCGVPKRGSHLLLQPLLQVGGG